jgi:hypothetical protein
MTQSTTQPRGDAQSPGSTGILINLIVTLLAPMFLAATEGDIPLARTAALDTIIAYRVQNHLSLMAVAKILAFGLTTLGSLSLSMADDLSISMILRLRGNANALDRAGDRNERALRAAQADSPAPGFDEAAVRAGVAEAEQRAAEARAQTPAATETPAETPPEAPTETPARAAATQQLPHRPAAEDGAAVISLPLPQRQETTVRAAMLSSTANSLLCGIPGSPPAPADRPG